MRPCVLIAALAVALKASLAIPAEPPALAAGSNGSPPAWLGRMDGLVEQALEDWGVPGASIAVVRRDRVVYVKGFGVREVGESAPVDEHTLFAIGSVTKGFTAALAAMLVDEGKMTWDEPLRQCLPDFQLADPKSAGQATLRDLLCHRVGLPRRDDLWAELHLDPEVLLRRISQVKPRWPLRSHFSYSNIMYLAAGEAVARVAEKPWETLVRERIFAPLEMGESCAMACDPPAGANAATGHRWVRGKLQTARLQKTDNCASAVAIWSNARDMAGWVRFQLGDGDYGDRRLVSPEAVKQIHTPQTVIPPSGELAKMFPDRDSLAYGLGWIVLGYRDRQVILHPGNVSGTRALVAMMPEENLGVVVLANRSRSLLPVAVMYQAFDMQLGEPPAERVARRTAALKKLHARYQRQDEAEWLTAVATKLIGAGRFDEAVKLLDQALRLDPTRTETLIWRGLAWLNKGDPDRAIADLTEAVELDPFSVHAFNNRGLARLRSGDKQRAIEDFTKAIELDPLFAEPHSNRGLAKSLSGDQASAITDAGRAIEIDPQFARAYAVRGMARLLRGQEDKAERDFDQCCRLQPAMKPVIAREVAAIKRDLARQERPKTRSLLGALHEAAQSEGAQENGVQENETEKE